MKRPDEIKPNEAIAKVIVKRTYDKLGRISALLALEKSKEEPDESIVEDLTNRIRLFNTNIIKLDKIESL